VDASSDGEVVTVGDDELLVRIDERVKDIDERTKKMQVSYKEICERQNEHGKRIVRIETRTGTYASVLGVFQLVFAAIAAWIGSKN
jgi:hypothetical protein